MFYSPWLTTLLTTFEQRMAISCIALFWLMTPINSIAIPIYLLSTRYWHFIVAYFVGYSVWGYSTRKIPSRGGAPTSFFRKCWPWALIRDYFSHTIVKTAELPADRNYIIGSHPHGILSVGGTLAYAGKVSGFNELYPGLRQCILTLEGQFHWPFRREAAMLIGKGRAVALVIGGLNESLMARPGHYDLKLKNRKGFVRQAFLHGASLVPSYHFGEAEIFDHDRGFDEKRLKNMQARLRNHIGFIPPFLKGVSLFGLPTGGLLPIKNKITTVIGEPIHVEKKTNPTEEEIDTLHSLYCHQLVLLFESKKHLHNIPNEAHLNIY